MQREGLFRHVTWSAKAGGDGTGTSTSTGTEANSAHYLIARDIWATNDELLSWQRADTISHVCILLTAQ